jgi:protein-disulfide isomerase
MKFAPLSLLRVPRLLVFLSSLLVSSAGLAADAASTPGQRWPIDPRGRPVLGKDTAPVVVVEVSSFKCSHCEDFHRKVFPRLREEFIDTGKVQWIMLNADDTLGDQFAPVFQIARCVQRQGKYWELLGRLFEAAKRPPSFQLDLVAQSPLLDREELARCMNERSTRNDVARDFAEYARLRMRGTPTYLVRTASSGSGQADTILAGLQTIEAFRSVLEKALRPPQR